MEREQVSSADNILRLLEALADRGRLRVGEAAELLSVAPSTAHRLLATLKRHQFVEQDRQRAYVSGRGLAQLVRNTAPMPDLSVLAHPYLAELSEATNETTHLVTLEGNGARFVDGVDSRQALRVGTRIGLLLPAHATSGGKVLLAQLTDAQLAELYPDRRLVLRDGTSTDLQRLRRELTGVRRQGYALNLEGTERGVNAIGVPVVSKAQRVVAAVVLACPSMRSTRESLMTHIPALRSVAVAISTL